MAGGIFLLDAAGELTEMAETAFAAEIDLQKLLADHPGLLPGDQINPGSPRRWLLVSREVGIPDQNQGGARWALDHLFLDQDGVPTLVEVKRGSDPRTRREVVGQMLDYAANSVLHWTSETLQASLAKRCQEGGLNPDEQIAQLLGGPATAGDFWQKVKTNLKAGKIRLLFVSDAIPTELRRIVEFLNEQMDPAEVLAVEIRQYAGNGLRTLVPRVLGQTVESLDKGGGKEARWDEPTFFAELTLRTGEEDARTARRILDWAQDRGCWIWWGKGAQDGSFFPMVRQGEEDYWMISVWTYGRIEVQFQWMRTRPPFNSREKRLELLRRLNEVLGTTISEDGIERRPSIPLRLLAEGGRVEGLLGVLDWVVGEVRTPSGTMLES